MAASRAACLSWCALRHSPPYPRVMISVCSTGDRRLGLVMQGAENFKKELEQLRRAFRYDEFETVTAAATPPKNVVVKARMPMPFRQSFFMALKIWTTA